MPILIILGLCAGMYLIQFAFSQWSASRGAITIIPERTLYSAGEVIKGKVIVDLKKALHAKKLDVTLVATKMVYQKEKYLGSNTAGRNNTQKREEILYSFTSTLGQEGDYSQGEFPFELLVPSLQQETKNLSQALGGAGALGKVASAILTVGEMGSALSNAINPNSIEWFLRSDLDLPSAIDLDAEVQIQVQ